jgi:ribosomal protein S6--L-glutamate ligase
MKIGFLYHSTISKIPKDTITLSKAFKKKSTEIHFLDVHKLSFLHIDGKLQINHEGKRLPKFDLLVSRINTFKKPHLYSYVTTLFKTTGATILNAWPAGKVSNKIVEHAESVSAKIPMPNWAIAKETGEILSAAKKIGYPLMVKIPIGTKGDGVFYIQTQTELTQLANYLTKEPKSDPLILESYVKEASNTDLRIFVVGGTAVAGMKRIAKKGEKRANISLGGSVKKAKLSKQEIALAEKAATSYGLDLAGVDMLRTKNGPVVIEVNSVPGGFKSLKELCGVDVPKMIYKFAIEKAKKNQKN